MSTDRRTKEQPPTDGAGPRRLMTRPVPLVIFGPGGEYARPYYDALKFPFLSETAARPGPGAPAGGGTDGMKPIERTER